MHLESLKALRDHLASAVAILDQAIGEHGALPDLSAFEFSPTPPPTDFEKIAALIPPLDVATKNFQTLHEKLVEVVGQRGPITYKDLYPFMKPYSVGPVYKTAFNSPDSHVARGILLLENAPGGARLRVNPDFEGDPTPPRSTYIDLMRKRNPDLDPEDPLVDAFALFLKLYTERVIWWKNGGQMYQANHLLKALGDRKRGIKGLIVQVVTGKDDQGLRDCVKAGIPQASMEWLVASNQDLFADNPALIEVSIARLKKALGL